MNIDISKLRGEYVYLELLSPDHRDLIRSLAKDERIWEFNKMLLVDDNYDIMYDEYFNTSLDKVAMGGQQTFVIKKITDHTIIGMSRLYEINSKEKTAVIGYTWYVPSVWGKVHNKECKLLMLQYVFEEMQFNRVELRVAHQNIRSQKAVEKIGGVKEGILRKHGYRNDGEIRHTVIYSIIDDEWLETKEKLLRLIAESKND
ncbi:MAG TPA: GNAT family protein [Chitinophagaceae bacterium]|jgi:RimJ/RimL family protein N-acetyltransferase|nr:GNAT family protein [Chitinophagaceae bacterium]